MDKSNKNMETMELIKKIIKDEIIVRESCLDTNYYGRFLFIKFQDMNGKNPDEIITMFGCGFDESISEFMIDWRCHEIIDINECERDYLCEIDKLGVIEEMCKRNRLCKDEINLV